MRWRQIMQTNKNSLFNLTLANSRKYFCTHCNKQTSLANSTKHENACKKNPKNFRECPVCKKLHSKDGVTCSYSCSNTYFRSGKNNGNWKDDTYQSTCFFHHGKKCLICGEEKIVAAHHVNGNHNDNRPENLVPLCPTHHQYVHSKYRNEIQPIIEQYLNKYLSVA
jgi:hypothetical protein